MRESASVSVLEMIRLFTTPDGGSRFGNLALSLSESFSDEFSNSYCMTPPLEVSSAVVVELPHGLDQDWHNPPNRQIVIVLSGRLEVETTDGELRRWTAGSILLAEDLHGRGHRTRVIEGPAKLVFLRLPAELPIPGSDGGQTKEEP